MLILFCFYSRPDVYNSNLIVKAGLSVTEYFKQKMEAKKLGIRQTSDEVVDNETVKRKNKTKLDEEAEEQIENVDEIIELNSPKQSKKKKRSLKIEEDQEISEDPPKKKKKKSKTETVIQEPEVEVEVVTEEPVQKKKKKKKSKKVEEEVIEVVEVEEEIEPTSSKKSKKKSSTQPEASAEEAVKTKKLSSSGEKEKLSGANAVYSTNVIQIPSHVAQKMSCMVIEDFKNSNVANVVGYGLTEEIEIKTVQTKVGENFNSTDKYSLYNMDKLTTRQKTNPRKILSKLKRTKKVITVI